MKHWIAAVLKQKCARMHQILFQFPFSGGDTAGSPPVGALPQTPGEGEGRKGKEREGRERAGRGKGEGRERGRRGRGGEVCVIAVGV